MIKLYTIGFAGKSAEKFFSLLKTSGIRHVVDTRHHPSSQLSGFAKGQDLKFFLKEICDISYMHNRDLAPTKDLLDRYRAKIINWKDYATEYLSLLRKRNVSDHINAQSLHENCFLCSEHSPENCHRKLVAEYCNQPIITFRLLTLFSWCTK